MKRLQIFAFLNSKQAKYLKKKIETKQLFQSPDA